MPAKIAPRSTAPVVGVSLRRLLSRFVLVIALPLLALGMLSTLYAVKRERLRFEDQLTQTSRTLAVAVDGELARLELLLAVVAGAVELGEGQFARFAARARRELGGNLLATLEDRAGQVLLEITPWPDLPAGALRHDDRGLSAAAFATRGAVISNLLRLPGGAYVIAAARRVEVEGRELLLTVMVPSSDIGRVLRAQGLPEGWVAAVVDRQGLIVARTRAEEEFLGVRARPRTMAALEAGGGGVIRSIVTHDGMHSTTAASRAPQSGFAVAMAAPEPSAWQDLQAVLGLPAIAGALMVILAIWGARRVAAQFLDGIAALAPGAEARLSGVRELDEAAGRLRESEAARTKAMRRMAESEARHRLAIEAFAGGIYECRPQENIVIRSPGHLRMIGEKRDAPQREWWVDRIHPEDRPRLDAELALVRENRQDRFEIEYRLRHRNGHYIWIWHRSLATRGAEGRVRSIVGSVIDITAEREARDKEMMLAREMNHRVKNSFALVSSLIGLTMARWPEAADFADELRKRVAALTLAHDIVLNGGGEMTLHGLIRRMAAPYATSPQGEATRVALAGEDVPMLPGIVPQFGLMLHEWLTNAAKYGALSVPEGVLHITTRREGAKLVLEWRETGGPPVVPPHEMGFGSLLSDATAAGLDGRLAREWPGEGLLLTLELALDRVEDTTAPTEASVPVNA